MLDDRLAALDASFIQIEDESSMVHVGGVQLFSGSPPRFDELLEHVEGRLEELPRFRQRLATVPLNLGRPRWVDDDRFRLRYHVRRTALPEPGGREELRALCGRLWSNRLDMRKPLWEIWLIEGLEGDRFALLSKYHHSLVDGLAMMQVLQTTLDDEPDPEPRGATRRRWKPRPGPSRARLMAEALVERTGLPDARALLGGAARAP